MMRIRVTVDIQDGTAFDRTTTIQREHMVDLPDAPYNNEHAWQISEAILATVRALTETDA